MNRFVYTNLSTSLHLPLNFSLPFKSELESLKLRTSHEIDRVRSSVRELYERENSTFREAREMALAEKEEAVAAAKRLADKVAQLQEDSKDARVNADSKASDAVNGLRLKTFELESLQALYEQALNAQKELQTENAHLSGKLEKLTKDHFETKSGLERINAELRTESKTLTDKLKVYENLEKEMDEVVMQCAELDDETQAEKVRAVEKVGVSDYRFMWFDSYCRVLTPYSYLPYVSSRRFYSPTATVQMCRRPPSVV